MNERGNVVRTKDDRPVELKGFTRKVVTACGNQYITIGYKDGRPYECQVFLGKSGGCSSAMLNGLFGLVSSALEYGMPIEKIIMKLDGISCHASNNLQEDQKLYCCPDGIASVLKIAAEITICPKCGSHVKDDGKCLNGECNWKKPKDSTKDGVNDDAK